MNKKFQQLGPGTQRLRAEAARRVDRRGRPQAQRARRAGSASSSACRRRTRRAAASGPAPARPAGSRRPGERPVGQRRGPPWHRPRPAASRSSPSCATQIDALDRELLALLNRRAGVARTIGELKQREGSLAFRPEREAAGDRRPEGAQPRPAADRERGADLARDHVGLPRARDADAGGLPRPGRHLQRAGGARLLRLVDRQVPCASIDEVFHATSAGAADFGVVPVENSSEGVVTRSLDLFLTTPLFIIGETSLLRAPQPAAPRRLARRHRRRLRPSAGARAVPRLAQPTTCRNAERRPVASNAEGARLASLDPSAGRHRQRARGQRVRPARRRAGDPGRRPQPHPLRDRHASRTRIRSRKASGHDCTSLVVSVANRPGAVHDMLVPLKVHGVSMTPLRVAAGALGPVGVLLLHRPAGPSRPARGRRGAAGAARASARSSSCSAPTRSTCTDRRARRSMFNQLGVIGCGLMGGSFALALQARRPGQARHRLQQVAVDHRAGASSSASSTTAAESALLAVSGSDIVLIAVPVSATEATFKAIRHLVEPGVLFMDVGSTKRDVVDAARRVLKERIVSFVPAHPIAGKEVAGIDARRRLAVPGPPGHPDAAAADHARAGAEGDRRLGGDRLAGAAHDAREPRRRLRRGQPPAAHAGVRLLQLGVAPAGGARLPLARPARAFATSRASPPATRRSGATS